MQEIVLTMGRPRLLYVIGDLVSHRMLLYCDYCITYSYICNYFFINYIFLICRQSLRIRQSTPPNSNNLKPA